MASLPAISSDFEQPVRPLGPGLLILFMVLYDVLTFVFHFPALSDHFSIPIIVGSGGLFSYTLVTYAVKAVLTIGLLVLICGRLRLSDLGLTPHGLFSALAVVTGLWIGAHGVVIAGEWMSGRSLVWSGPGYIDQPSIGRFLENVLGTALTEEVVYRGLLVTQLFLVLERFWPDSDHKRWIVAVGISSWYFGINHLSAGYELFSWSPRIGLYLLHTMLVGAFFAVIYLRTANLWLVVGLHALVNAPALLLETRLETSTIVLALAVLFFVVAPWPLRRQTDSLWVAGRIAKREPAPTV